MHKDIARNEVKDQVFPEGYVVRNCRIACFRSLRSFHQAIHYRISGQSRVTGQEGRGDGGEAEGDADQACRTACSTAPCKLVFKVAYFCLTLRAGSGTVTFMLTFRCDEFDFVFFCYLLSDVLQNPADFFSSWNSVVFYRFIYSNLSKLAKPSSCSSLTLLSLSLSVLNSGIRGILMRHLSAKPSEARSFRLSRT